MSKKLTLFVLLLSTLLITVLTPAYATGPHQDDWAERQSFIWGTDRPETALATWNRASSDPVGYMVSAAELEALRQQFNIERSYTTPPPPLQAFSKFVISDDYWTVFICTYNPWTGEQYTCEVFF